MLLFCIFAPLIIAVGQMTAPYQQYDVIGNVESFASQKPIERVTVILVGKFSGGSEWFELQKFITEDTDRKDLPIALTDSLGNFKIVVTPQFDKLDSIAPALVLQNKGLEIGQAISMKDIAGTAIKTRYTYSNESGCSCENTTSSELVTAGYVYKVNNLKIITKNY